MGSLALDYHKSGNFGSSRWLPHSYAMDSRSLGAFPFARQKLPVPDVPVTGPTQHGWTRLGVLRSERANHHVMMMMRTKQAENPADHVAFVTRKSISIAWRFEKFQLSARMKCEGKKVSP